LTTSLVYENALTFRVKGNIRITAIICGVCI